MNEYSRLCFAVFLAGAGCAAPAAEPNLHHTYVPDRPARIVHLALEVKPDFRQRTVAGTATVRFQPVGKPCLELRLDAVDLTVTNVTSTEKVRGWQVLSNQVVITMAAPVPVEREAVVTLYYRAQPREGLYFRTPELGYRAEDTHLFSQGESITARQWYPCFDAPSDKFTSEITCHVPKGMVVLANGRKVSEESRDGQVVVRWVQDKPHANYLISLVAGYFKKIEARYKDVPMAFWTVPSQAAWASNSFRDTAAAMEFFERETGVPYPWVRYDQVCVQDFVAGGMENTSQTTLTDHTLFGDEFENTRNSQGLISHELAHQWFGDLVTCRDWSHLWLNEGFATYYEELFDGHQAGPEELAYRMWLGCKALTANTNETRSIVTRRFTNPDEQFNALNYGKGGWVLHMLRTQLGEDLYRRCVKTFLERHAYGSVVTADFVAVVEELSGRSFEQFFDQWVYHPGFPQVDADYAWDEPTKTARLTLRQVQAVTDAQPLFRFPLPVRFRSKSGVTDREVIVQNRSEEFSFPLPERPEMVRLDPGVTVLAKITFKPTPEMLRAQLATTGDVVGRLLALEQLGSRPDVETIALLRRTLQEDRFYAVREAASKALRGLHTSEALEVLLDSTRQPDARVRRQVITDLAGFYGDAVLARLLQVLREEKNPDILAEAIRGLSPYIQPEVTTALTNWLASSSFGNLLADAAIATMRVQNCPEFIRPLLETLEHHEADFTAGGFGAGLETLAVLARAQENKEPVRQFLSRHTNHRRRAIQRSALVALGLLEDPKALPLLQTFVSAAKDNPARPAAEQAVEAIRAARRPASEPGGLRKEVQDLARENRQLRTDLEALRKKVELLSAPAPKTKLRAPPTRR